MIAPQFQRCSSAPSCLLGGHRRVGQKTKSHGKDEAGIFSHEAKLAKRGPPNLERIGQLRRQLRNQFPRGHSAEPTHFSAHMGLVGEACFRGKGGEVRTRRGRDELEQTLETKDPL